MALRPLGDLPVGARFRFREEAGRQGYPYVVTDIPASYKVVKGQRYFEDDEQPIVIRRADRRYPRYGTVEGFFPVRGHDGRHCYWVGHPRTEVVVPSAWEGVLLGYGWALLGTVVLLASGLAGAAWLFGSMR